ncbi:sugar ABC transporter substrate-binding protein [Streptomyces durbertensis]|uniref:Sugar ABC transporter substrate-binding protein n=1 Tax=Streptomyces durbertensis TaxID=2448886 RepID=A0ABR6EH15_9ACTN|nr:sugar ABC transporter substrate-binding protein [Streptomyces durbertensis]MBB1244621.1 sugar ABC transporter substrate-binding protein [Streptomyces durbertensis]
MNATVRRTAVVVAASAMAVSLAACGTAKEAGGNSGPGEKKKDGPLSIGLLLPEDQTARYENFDRPLIEAKIKELCSDCTVTYVNAKQDASVQQQQMDSMITKKVDVIILDAVDSKSIAGSVKKADAAGIPVVAYDRLAEGPISAYTSFDNEEVGRVQGRALLEALGDKAGKGQIVMMNGSPTDPNAAMFKKGALSVLEGKVKIGKSYDTTEWKPSEANKNMNGALAALGKDNVVGVYSANDGMAGGIITALKGAGFKELPPVTGQDAELAGVQRIIAGEQFMSVYKPYKPEADAAAEMAIALGRGEKVNADDTIDSATTKGVPAILIPPVSLTVENLEETVLKDGLYKLNQICTPKYRAACEKAGLK